MDLCLIKEVLRNSQTRDTLIVYCQYLASKYDETNEGKYRIKYNALYPVLFHSLEDSKILEFFNSFATSLDIYPIKRIDTHELLLDVF